MNSTLRNVSFLVLLVFTASGAMLAQGGTAAISGQVTDETGALVPGVEILIENLEMGFTRTVVTEAVNTNNTKKEIKPQWIRACCRRNHESVAKVG